MSSMKYSASICIEIDGSTTPPTVRRAFIISGPRDAGELRTHAQRFSGMMLWTMAMGVAHAGDTLEQATDAALSLTAGFPWLIPLLGPDVGATVLQAHTRHRARLGLK